MPSILFGFAELLAPIRCPGCDDRVQHDEDFCGACISQLEPSDHPHASFVHIGPLARSIHRLKYEGRTDFAPRLARLASDGLVDVAGQVDRVLAVPAHRARRIERGYDQALLLARDIARMLQVPHDRTSLVRLRSTGQQVGRNREERLGAMRGAFTARGLAGARVLLVDDVVTTGATFDAAEEACRAAGARSVLRLAIAAAPT